MPFQIGAVSCTPKFSTTRSKPSGLLEAKGMKTARKTVMPAMVAKCFFIVLFSPLALISRPLWRVACVELTR